MAHEWTDDDVAALVAHYQAAMSAGQPVDWQPVAERFGVSKDAARMRAYAALDEAGLPRARKGESDNRPTAKAPPPPFNNSTTEQEVEDTDTGDAREVRSYGKRIKTIDDLLKHIDADMDVWEVDKPEATKNEQVSKDADGNPVVTEYFRVFVRLKRRGGPDTRDQVEAMIDAAFAERTIPKPRISIVTRNESLAHEIIVADAHIGKFAWGDQTGGPNFDTPIAERLVRESIAEHLARSEERRPARRAIRILGDWSNHDTIQGTTTAGTQVEHDSRLPKVIDVGAELLFDAIEESARTAETVVMFVPGNHDEVLTWAFQKIVAIYFRNHPRVTVDTGYTFRKYDEWGLNLLGFAHGDKAKKKLPGLMALEAREAWGRTRHREIHTGHLHSVAAIESIDGVITRTAPSLAAIDGWHAKEGYVGAMRGMESYYYHKGGGVVATETTCPDYRLAA